MALFEVRDLGLEFQLANARTLKAVQNVTFSLEQGKTLGIVGESGCGKSSLARALARLHEPTSGTIQLLGKDFLKAKGQTLKDMRREIQMIFQDPYSSLDPRQTIGDAIMEPMRIYKLHENNRRAQEGACLSLLEKVGLSAVHFKKFPHEFSGGQLQRVVIARALALSPRIIIADEPVSALDVSIRAQILNLLRHLQAELGLAIIFIAHDLSLVRYMAHSVAVMYLGRFVEYGPTENVCAQPAHHYTRMLIESSLTVRAQKVQSFDLPSPLHVSQGCPFHERCPAALAICQSARPEVTHVPSSTVEVRCHAPRQGTLFIDS